MAEVLESYAFRHRKPKYPWDIWLDGRPWRLTKGVDFQCLASSLRATAITQAFRRNKSMQTNCPDENTLVLQAVAVTEDGDDD